MEEKVVSKQIYSGETFINNAIGYSESNSAALSDFLFVCKMKQIDANIPNTIIHTTFENDYILTKSGTLTRNDLTGMLLPGESVDYVIVGNQITATSGTLSNLWSIRGFKCSDNFKLAASFTLRYQENTGETPKLLYADFGNNKNL